MPQSSVKPLTGYPTAGAKKEEGGDFMALTRPKENLGVGVWASRVNGPLEFRV